ncbi:hypothetical protein ILYODFUR_018793 [Ilyodon furcidens]|uniref:Uncharacterized protein n=1 Tax=Ilyodon furcidens TaxID=33524 RepID=A0ABV0VFS7_9TELE
MMFVVSPHRKDCELPWPFCIGHEHNNCRPPIFLFLSVINPQRLLQLASHCLQLHVICFATGQPRFPYSVGNICVCRQHNLASFVPQYAFTVIQCRFYFKFLQFSNVSDQGQPKII